MAPRTTRSKAATITSVPDILAPQLIMADDEPHKMFILPKDSSNAARIMLLRNPATSVLTRYFYCSKLGLYEFTKVLSAQPTPRSCLVAADADCKAHIEFQCPKSSSQPVYGGYLLQDADFFVATPLDPVFLLVSLFSVAGVMYRPADDYFDQLAETSVHMERLLRDITFRQLLLNRLKAVSMMQDVGGGEEVYKPQLQLLLNIIIEKAGRVINGSWPVSMEDGLVRRELEIPITMLLVDGEDGATTSNPRDDKVLDTSQAPNSTPTEIVETPGVPSHVLRLMRLRTTLQYLTSRYIPPSLRTPIETLLSVSSHINFKPLEDHLERVKSAKTEVQALRSLSDNISRKRSTLDDDEATEARSEKKRKKEEEEIRKKSESKAIKQLKKVDTSGMKKMSSFFAKTAPPIRSQTSTS